MTTILNASIIVIVGQPNGGQMKYLQTEVFGPLPISTARKSGLCQYGRRVTGGPRCINEIKVGDQYVGGEHQPDFAAGFGRPRWCMECAAMLTEAKAA